MNRRQLSTESSRLLQQPIINEPSPQSQQESSTCSCKHLCLPSKAAILMIFWAAAVGAVYTHVLLVTAVLIDTNPLSSDISISANVCLPYAILAFVTMFYPLSGFIADVCCGRFKTVVIGLCFILAFILLMVLAEIVVLVTNLKVHSLITYYNYSTMFHQAEGLIAFILVIISLVTFMIGLAGYQANLVQLGLDQLFEAPSQYLSLFILYAIWTFKLGSVPLTVTFPLFLCRDPIHQAAIKVLAFFPLIIAVFLILLLVISWRKHHWFYTEAGHENPYKTVFKIINFARKHKHPLQRSAFTFSDNYIPSRLDFAKERYGGPFTTEQVESVKTFLRILIVLFAMGPIFTLEVPASYFIFPLFGFHTLQRNTHLEDREFCTGRHTILGVGTLMNILSTLVIFPIYMCFTYSILHKKVCKMLTRLFVGAVLCLLGVASLLIIDTVGHSLKHTTADISNHTQCMFHLYRTNGTLWLQYPALDMHWSVLIPPSLFLGVGPLILMTATLEFISAQSPQSMKGLLIGLFFAIRGLFQFLNSIITVPFSLKHPWASGEMLEHPPVTNCGFVYLLFTCVAGLIGLILFLIVAKKYKYRARNAEDLFRQADIEEIYDRYITQASIDSNSYDISA